MVESTNLYTNSLLSQNGIIPWTFVTADHQTKGRGQRGNGWFDEPGKNIALSLAFKPELKVDQQFRLSALAILAVTELLSAHGISTLFKWPNDILVDGKKIAGILIENQLKGQRIEWSVIGIGLNVNQLEFPSFNWAATSMKAQATSEVSFDREVLIEGLMQNLARTWENLCADSVNLGARMTPLLFGMEKIMKILHNGQERDVLIKGLGDDGALIVLENDQELRYNNGEIKLRNDA